MLESYLLETRPTVVIPSKDIEQERYLAYMAKG